MKGEWVQAESGTWHLIWTKNSIDGAITSWCARTFQADDPQKPGGQISGFEDILHDECLRKAEEL